MLEARGLFKYYGSVPALRNVSFHIGPGQVLGYLGPNGSGKSTTVKLLTGILEPTRGQVLFSGKNIHDDLVSYRKRLGYVPEEANLYGYMTGEEYLEMVGTFREMPSPVLSQRVDGLLELFSLTSQRSVPMSSYSKGMRQKILLIAALMDDPEILILDEPLSGLDAVSSLIFRYLIQGLCSKGKAIFIAPTYSKSWKRLYATAHFAKRGSYCARVYRRSATADRAGLPLRISSCRWWRKKMFCGSQTILWT